MACNCGRNRKSTKKVNSVSPTVRLNSLLNAKPGASKTSKVVVRTRGPFRVQTVPKTTAVQKVQ